MFLYPSDFLSFAFKDTIDLNKVTLYVYLIKETKIFDEPPNNCDRISV